jgi:hypothetical protein
MTSLDIGGDPAKQLCEQFLPVSGTFERPAWIPLLQGTVSELARKLYNLFPCTARSELAGRDCVQEENKR